MPNLKYPVGTHYSNSKWYDAATAEVVHGWQVFEQHSPDGKPTGSKSFVDNAGVLCGIEIAERRRKGAIEASAVQLLHELKKLRAAVAEFVDAEAHHSHLTKSIEESDYIISQADGIQP